MIAEDSDCSTGNQATQEQTGVDAAVIAVCQGRIGSTGIPVVHRRSAIGPSDTCGSTRSQVSVHRVGDRE